MSYILGRYSDEDDEVDSDEDDEVDSDEDDEINMLSAEEFRNNSLNIKNYVNRINTLIENIQERIFFKNEEYDDLTSFLKEDILFSEIINDIINDIYKRISLSYQNNIIYDENEIPRYCYIENKSRNDFIKSIMLLSNNNKNLFGRILTPIVNKIRMVGRFKPNWSEEQPKLVLIDGEGLGHDPNSVINIPTSITNSYGYVDKVLLVDNAQQPMQAASTAVIRNLITTGYGSKLVVCFTHFDLVKGDNFHSSSDKEYHVKGSMINTFNLLNSEIKNISDFINIFIEDNAFFLANLHKNLNKNKNIYTINQLNKLVIKLSTSIEYIPFSMLTPTFKKSQIMTGLNDALKKFGQRWLTILGFGFHEEVRKEHWTRIKALNKRIAYRIANEYNNLQPIPELRRYITESVYNALSSAETEWDNPFASFEDKDYKQNIILQKIQENLYNILNNNLIEINIFKWKEANDKEGKNSTVIRAYIISELIKSSILELIPDSDDYQLSNIILDEVIQSILSTQGKVI